MRPDVGASELTLLPGLLRLSWCIVGNTCSKCFFWPLLRRLPDGAVLHAGQPPDVSGPAERDHLHQNALLRHHRPGLGTPLRAVPRPAAPLQARLHPQHPHRSLSRSDNPALLPLEQQIKEREREIKRRREEGKCDLFLLTFRLPLPPNPPACL